MTRKSIVILLTVTLLCAASALAATPATLKVTLTIERNKTLPGLSVPLLLRVENQGRAMFLSPYFKIYATSPSGHSFFLNITSGVLGLMDLGVTDEDDPRFPLPARRMVDLAVPAGGFGGGTWASDGRVLQEPGEWTLQVYLFEDLRKLDKSEPDANEEDAPRGPAGISNAAKVTFEVPGPRDLPIWQALRRGERVQIAETVLLTRPDSPYFPYLATWLSFGHNSREQIEIYKNAIALHPDSPAVPALRYAMALRYGQEADRVFVEENDFEKAVEMAEKGRAELLRLKNGDDPWSRLVGNEKWENFPSREGFVEEQEMKEKYKPH